MLNDPHVTLGVSGIAGLAAAAVYGYVGTRFMGRSVDDRPEPRRAVRLFGLWWIAFGVATTTTALGTLLAAMGKTEVALHLAFFNFYVVAASVAYFSLLYYLLYLLTGSHRILVPLAVIYGALYLLALYIMMYRGVVGVHVGAWQAFLLWGKPLDPALRTFTIATRTVPQIVAALAYFTLFFRLHDPTMRWRVGLVSWAIVFWFGTVLGGYLLQYMAEPWWQLFSTAVGASAALTVLMAYRPPRWAQQTFGVVALGREAMRPVDRGEPGIAFEDDPARGETG
jgi:hypothetical protein